MFFAGTDVLLRYNILNLPDIVQFKDGNQIINKYDAGGQKLQSIYYTQLTALSVPLSEGEVFHPTYTAGTYDYRGTAYAGNAEYGISRTFINQYGGYYNDKYTLSKVYNTEGYTDGTIIPDETNYRYGIRYNYYRRDHLGNNCIVLK